MARQAFQMEGASGSRDATGIISFSVPFFVPTLTEVLKVTLLDSFGLKETGRSWSAISGFSDDSTTGGGWQVQVTYEGLEDGRDDGDNVYEFEPHFSEEPIEAHRLFPDIKDFYGGTLDAKGKVTWPATISKGNAALGKAREVTNPVAGLESYFALAATFKRTYAAKKLPSDLLQNIGRIEDALPGEFPTPRGRDWLVMPPKVSYKGNAYQISEEWLLSPAGGKWPKKVYGLIEL